MYSEELKQREPHFKEFGEILVNRHGQNYYSSYQDKNRVTIDETATRFGRYLRAARINVGLSITDLATHSRLSEARIVALENGLYLACDIKQRWLKHLACPLQQSYEDFEFLLGRPTVTKPNAYTFATIASDLWQSWLKVSRLAILSKPIYATFTAFLLCIAVSILLLLSTKTFSDRSSPQQQTSSFINIAPEQRLNMIKAELGFESQVLVIPATYLNESGSCCIQ